MNIFILDAGHGGIINGKPVTPGKRSPVWSDGSQLIEGELNRSIASIIKCGLADIGIESILLVNTDHDTSLTTRVHKANKIASDDPNNKYFYVSIHSNAGGGKGFEVFTYFGQSKSDELAECIAVAFMGEFPDKPLRADKTDGDLDKESSFYVLRKTRIPAILTENFFMDNEQECKEILMTPEGRQKIANYHINGIAKFNSMA